MEPYLQVSLGFLLLPCKFFLSASTMTFFFSSNLLSSYQLANLSILEYCRSLLGNNLSGSIPKEIGDIATLEELWVKKLNYKFIRVSNTETWQVRIFLPRVLEENQLEGQLHENLGNLGRLKRL